MSVPGTLRRIIVAATCAAAFVLASCTGNAELHVTPNPPTTAPQTGVLPPPGSPNIVFVLTDDLASNLVQYMPHVLALQKRGMTFADYSVTDSLCCPSRASILTGEYPHNTKITTNGGLNGGFRKFTRLNEPSHTFGAELQAAGYRTALIGKYLNGYSPSFPLPSKLQALTPPALTYVPPGWSEWDGVGYGYNNYNYDVNHDHVVERYGSRPADYLTTVVQNRAVSFISSSIAAQRPFLLEVATFAPHLPATPAPQDLAGFPDVRAPRTAAFDRLPLNAPAWLRRHRPPLTAQNKQLIDREFRTRVRSVQAVDRMIGTLEQKLRSTGQLDNTVFVFSSDNGFHMGEYRLDPGKLTAFDTDIEVPLVVAGPHIPAGRVNHDIVQNIDLAPTFEALGGARVPTQTDGRSLVPLLHGQHPIWRTLAAIEHRGAVNGPGDPDLQSFVEGNPPTYVAIRGATFTYVRYADGEREYYDRSTDPDELDNIYSRLSPGTVARLDREVEALHTCQGLTSCWLAGEPGGG